MLAMGQTPHAKEPRDRGRLCECGCRMPIPWAPFHKYKPPRFIGRHGLKGIDRTIKPPIGWRAPSGLCECGCGERTGLAKTTSRSRDQYCGFPIRFIRGHASRLQGGEVSVNRKDRRRSDGYKFHGRTGYWMIKASNSPMADKHGMVMEHRLVMSEMIGRPLTRDEEVHHKNGDRGDNRPENLELWAKGHRPGQRVKDLLAWAREILARYADLPGNV